MSMQLDVMRRVTIFVYTLSLILQAGLDGQALAQQAVNLKLGERIYHTGQLADGSPLIGTIQGDIRISGSQVSCVHCHRRSGYGTSEGGIYVLPITGPILYAPRELDRANLFKKLYTEIQPRTFWARMRSPKMRPAYTDDTLARAIRDGIDASGRVLASTMPRYELDDQNMAYLTAHLKTLAAKPDPGVDEQVIYFATIVGPNTDSKAQHAMVSTLNKFVEWMNLDTVGDTRNPNFSPYHRSQFIKAYRLWQLDVWRLGDDPSQWQSELETYYAKRPVFALISGMVRGTWYPIQQFLERKKVLCLFPHTDLTRSDEPSVYSIHFTRGLDLEADVIGRYLLLNPPANTPSRVIQLYQNTLTGTVPAQRLKRLLDTNPIYAVEHHEFDTPVVLRQQLATLSAQHGAIDTLIVWPGQDVATTFNVLVSYPNVASRIMLPAAVVDILPSALPAKFEQRLLLSYPYSLPSAYHPRRFRVRAWMRTQGLEVTHPRIQFNTYYALTLAQFGLEHIVDNFSRDYLLEYIEHEAENSLNPGTYPRLSLGPGQRFASKGAYIVKLATQGPHRIIAASDWIVP